ncbi:hypothetical protein HAX54_025655, partial [Datura stramonium]|nr:hypothetical protein [Datura stramonium]
MDLGDAAGFPVVICRKRWKERKIKPGCRKEIGREKGERESGRSGQGCVFLYAGGALEILGMAVGWCSPAIMLEIMVETVREKSGRGRWCLSVAVEKRKGKKQREEGRLLGGFWLVARWSSWRENGEGEEDDVGEERE